MMSSGCQENFFWIIICIKLLYWILTSKELAISKIRSNKVTKHEKHLAARTRKFSHGKVSLSADGKHRNASVATSQRWTNRQNPESRQNLIPLISGPTSQTRKQPDKPHLLRPGPTQPQSQGQAMQHTFDCRQQTGRRSVALSKKKKKKRWAPSLEAWLE